MKTSNRSYQRLKFLVAGVLLFAIFLIHQSFRKMDTNPASTELTSSNPTERFFQLPANVSPSVRKIAEKMGMRNDKNEFVKQFIKDNGYPKWDKAINTHKRSWPVNTSLTGSASLSDEGDMLIIPVVSQDGKSVTSFIGTKDSTQFDLYRGADYERMASTLFLMIQ